MLRTLAAAGLLILMTIVAYLPVTYNRFIPDDDAHVTKNENLRSLRGLGRLWFKLGATPHYYPVVHTTFWVEYHLWKLRPGGYHWVNILLHATGAVLLWRVLALLRVPGAWVAAAVFALHPVHVESVAWISERKNVLSGIFYLGAALTYLHYAPPKNLGSRHHDRSWLYAASLILFLCALLSKTVTCSLPAALLLAVWWKNKRLSWADLRPLMPFFSMGLGLSLVTIWLEKHHVGATGEDWQWSYIERCLIAGRALWFYAGKLFWPHALSYIYPRWVIDAAQWWQYLFPIAVLVAVAALWLARHRLGRGPLAAVLFFAGTLVPALGFFDIYPMRHFLVADHFQYLASVGMIVLAVAVVSGAAARLGRWTQAPAAVSAAAVLAILGTLTCQRGYFFKDCLTLWTDTVQKNPGASLPQYMLGLALQQQGDWDRAEAHFNKALEIAPDSFEVRYHFALALQLDQRLDKAIVHYREALKNKPNEPDVLNNLGLALLTTGQPELALEYLDELVRLKPKSPQFLNSLARILATHPDPDIRDPDRAVELAERAATLDEGRNPLTLDTLAAAYAAAGQFDRAVATANKALERATGAKHLAHAIFKHRQLYLQKKPYLKDPTGASGPGLAPKPSVEPSDQDQD